MVTKTHSLNLESGGQPWYVVGFCLVPDNASTIKFIVVDISQRPCRAELLVDGDFNGNLAAPEGNVRDKEIDVALATVVLEDMSAHLLSFSKPWLRDG